jgi:hypothetical protein
MEIFLDLAGVGVSEQVNRVGAGRHALGQAFDMPVVTGFKGQYVAVSLRKVWGMDGILKPVLLTERQRPFYDFKTHQLFACK